MLIEFLALSTPFWEFLLALLLAVLLTIACVFLLPFGSFQSLTAAALTLWSGSFYSLLGVSKLFKTINYAQAYHLAFYSLLGVS